MQTGQALLYTILGEPGQTGDTLSCLEMLALSPWELQVSEGLCAHTKKFIKLFEAYGCSEMEIPLHFSWLVLSLWLGWCLTNHFGHSVVSGAWNITTKSDTSGES